MQMPNDVLFSKAFEDGGLEITVPMLQEQRLG